MAQELRDRFGRLPEEAHHLLYGVRVRVMARRARVESVVRRGDEVTLTLLDAVGGARLALQQELGHGSRVGHQQVHVPAAAGDDPPWGQALLEVMERLEEFQRRIPELLTTGD